MGRQHREAVIAQEQKAVDHAYHCLEQMKREKEWLSRNPAGASAKDNAAQRREYERLLQSYDLTGNPLVFMRVDVEEEGEPETFYIGRRAVRDAEGNRVVVSWTTEAAKRWRLARQKSPGDLLLRRRLACRERRVTEYFDEINRLSAAASPARVAAIVGSDKDEVDPFLLEELDRARDGLMRDIVETIQRDQLELVSDNRPGTLVIQGGPGTGKTAVGLHRVTWMLDNNRFTADQILVVGPHQEFLDYVGQVLPALGSRGVATRRLRDLWEGQVNGTDTEEQRRIKSDTRMARVLERAVRNTVRPEALDKFLTGDDEFRMSFEGTALTVPGEEIRRFHDQARQVDGPQRLQRDRFVDALVDRLVTEAVQSRGGRGRDRRLRIRINSHPQVASLVNAMWPQVSETRLLRRLLNDPEELRAAAEGLLSEEEQRALLRPRAKRADEEPWTEDDLVCLEELRFLLSGTEGQRYRHIVVDEAQDLTPMQVRSLARRCPSGSMTVLGDLAQSTGVHRYEDWSAFAALLTLPDGWHLEELTAGYRVPREVMDIAAPVAVTVSPLTRFPDSVRPRRSGAVTVVATTADSLLTEIGTQLRRFGDERSDRSVAVLVDDGSELLSQARNRFAAGRSGDGDRAPTVRVLPVSGVNGLEFDHVILVEPEEIAESGEAGYGRLYVALTRCTQSLTIVHARPLPDVLADPSEWVREPAAARRCSRYHADGTRCTNLTKELGGWCRQDGCGGYRTRRPVRSSHHSGFPRIVASAHAVRIELTDEQLAGIRVTPEARNSFLAHHRGTPREAEVEIRAMLEDFRHGARQFRQRDGQLLLQQDRYRLALSPGADAVTGYWTVHQERSYAQVKAGVPSRLRVRDTAVPTQQEETEKTAAADGADTSADPHRPDTTDTEHHEVSMDKAETIADGFLPALREAVRADRTGAHEQWRHILLGELYGAGKEPKQSEVADVFWEGPSGTVLYEVLAEGGHTYAGMRDGVLRAMEVRYADGIQADHVFLVLTQPPAEPWAVDAVSRAFGVAVIWRDGDRWAGQQLGLALGKVG